jgi:hypothetical protein
MLLTNVRDLLKTNLVKIITSTGIDLYLIQDDRRVLQTIIFPNFAHRTEFSKVLFVGTAWYTRGYRHFFEDGEYWTLEIDPALSKYGSKHHIVDSFANVSDHFQPGEFDLIVCNGVFGSGLNAKPEVESAFKGSHYCLREGGIFVLGWNDIPEKRPFTLAESESLRLFAPYVFPPLNSSSFLTANPNRHTFNFYIK